MLKKSLPQSGIAGALFLVFSVTTFLVGTSLPATAQASAQDVASLQTSLQNLANFLQQTSANDPNQLALANNLQNQINGLTSAQLYQVADSVNVPAFTNAVNLFTTAQPTQRNQVPTDPPSNLFNPNFMICQLVQQAGQAAGLTLVPSDPGVVKALETAIDVAKVAAVGANALCGGVVVVAGEGTTLPQCIIADVLNLIAEALERAKEVLTFCDPVVSSAETEATWRNSVVIDSDLATHDTNVANHLNQIDQRLTSIDSQLSSQSSAVNSDIDNRIVAVDTDLASRLTNTDADLNNNLTGVNTILNTNISLVDTHVNTRATQIDTEISTLQALALRMRIEESLTTGQMVGLFEIPQSQGGYLELVRSIVLDTINKVLSSGLTVGTASKNLTTGDSARASGQFKTAYKYYASAYQAAVN